MSLVKVLFYFSRIGVKVDIEFLARSNRYRVVCTHVGSPVVGDVDVAPVASALVDGKLGTPPVDARHLDVGTELTGCSECRRLPCCGSVGRSGHGPCGIAVGPVATGSGTYHVGCTRIDGEVVLYGRTVDFAFEDERVPATVLHDDVAVAVAALRDFRASIVCDLADAVEASPVSIKRTPLELAACRYIDHGVIAACETEDGRYLFPAAPCGLDRRTDHEELVGQFGCRSLVGSQHIGQGDDVGVRDTLAVVRRDGVDGRTVGVVVP